MYTVPYSLPNSLIRLLPPGCLLAACDLRLIQRGCYKHMCVRSHICTHYTHTTRNTHRYMTINTALEQLLEIEESRKEGAYDSSTLAVGISRLGAPDQQMVAGGMGELLGVDFGAPLHCLVIAGSVHVVEEEILGYYRCVFLCVLCAFLCVVSLLEARWLYCLCLALAPLWYRDCVLTKHGSEGLCTCPE